MTSQAVRGPANLIGKDTVYTILHTAQGTNSIDTLLSFPTIITKASHQPIVSHTSRKRQRSTYDDGNQTHKRRRHHHGKSHIIEDVADDSWGNYSSDENEEYDMFGDSEAEEEQDMSFKVELVHGQAIVAGTKSHFLLLWVKMLQFSLTIHVETGNSDSEMVSVCPPSLGL